MNNNAPHLKSPKNQKFHTIKMKTERISDTKFRKCKSAY